MILIRSNGFIEGAGHGNTLNTPPLRIPFLFKDTRLCRVSSFFDTASRYNCAKQPFIDTPTP